MVLLTDGEPATHTAEETLMLLRAHTAKEAAQGRPLPATLLTVGYGYQLDR